MNALPAEATAASPITDPAAPAVLEVAGLGFSYGAKRVLESVGFTVRRGEFLVLLGPNGAGKTTLFSLLTRLYETPEGTVRIDGHALGREPCRALAAMGVVFQQPTLDLDLTVRQNLLYHAALHGLHRRDALARIDAELERLAMKERLGEKVRNLNGGHRRRVEIARALVHRPRLLLLDEPTVGLDVPSREAIVAHVHALARERGVAVLWATHLIDEVRDGDRVVVLHHGRIRAEGTVPELLRETRTANLGAAFAALTREDAQP
ncbi:MAG: ATP-binding cassette domain-containing protein [Alphaproteobacteria bacterium]|nr:MAG: ATP-binding cassette domain-containing protein [Alphaproteobacteria bacterium]